MWKETRVTSSNLQQAPHGALLLAGASKTIAGSSSPSGQCVQVVVKAEKSAADAPNVMQAMMLFQQAKNRAKATQDRAKAAQDEAKVANKVALQAEKDNDTAQKEVQELQRVMKQSRVSSRRTHFCFLALLATMP